VVPEKQEEAQIYPSDAPESSAVLPSNKNVEVQNVKKSSEIKANFHSLRRIDYFSELIPLLRDIYDPERAEAKLVYSRDKVHQLSFKTASKNLTSGGT
jgi:hypothetical protein